MGAVLGLGIKREWLGDIWVSGENAVVFVLKSVERHVADGLDKVGRLGVKVSAVDLGDVKAPERKVKKVSFSVKSMRFDAVLAGLFGLSRTAAAACIAQGEASLNYSECTKNDAAVTEGDVISLRGHGKAMVSGSGGVSRKGRLFVEAEIYH
jgi:RNA-binding protein YlmH